MKDNLMNKMLRYEQEKEKKIKKHNEEIEVIEKVIDAIKKYSEIQEADTFETIVFKKYLELENVSKVAKEINELGYRIKTDSHVGERKYISSDITEIVIKDNEKVEKELDEVVKFLQEKNYNRMLKSWV